MWLDAIVTSGDLQRVVDQLTPATVPLGTRGQLFFDKPAEVSFVADRGIRLRCRAKVLWPVLGIDVALGVSSMTILVVPSVESRRGERVLVFAPEVEALDLALLPDIGDAELRAYLNRELQEKRVELPWNYQQTLDHQFALPDWLRSGATFDIRSNGAAVKVTHDSIGLAIGLSASVESHEISKQRLVSTNGVHGEKGRAQRTGDGARALAEASPRPSTPIRRALSATRRQPWLGLGVAVASGFGIGCLFGLRQWGR